MERYTPKTGTPSGRAALQDPGVSSAILRTAAHSSQQASAAFAQAAGNQFAFEAKELGVETQIAKQRRDVNIAYQQDSARLQFDDEMRTFLRTAPEEFTDRPEQFYSYASDYVRKRADHIAATAFDSGTQTTYARFQNDPEAGSIVRGDLYQRGQEFLREADAVTTRLTVAKHARTIAAAEETGIREATSSANPAQVAKIVADMTGTYARAGGTTMSADEVVKRTRQFSDRAWMSFYEQSARDNPDVYLDRIAFGKTPVSHENQKEVQDLTYRAFLAKKGAYSETTLTNALQLGNLTPEAYKDLLKSKGLDDKSVSQRMYAYAQSEIAAGGVPIVDLPKRLQQWSAAGMDDAQVNSLKSAVYDNADRAMRMSDRAREERDRFSKENAERIESAVYEQILAGKVSSIADVRGTLQLAMEGKGINAHQKMSIEKTAETMLAAGGKGDGLKRNRYELDIRVDTSTHSKKQILNDPTLNLVEKSDLIKLIESEEEKGKKTKDSAYEQELKNVNTLYGPTGPMEVLSDAGKRTLVTARQRYDDLVVKYKLHPRDAFKTLTQELTPLRLDPQFHGLQLPPLQQVQQLAQSLRDGKPLPPGVTPELVRYYAEQYRVDAAVKALVPPSK